MIVFLADVIDFRADRSMPLNAAAAAQFDTIAVPKALGDEDVGCRLMKNA